MRRQSKNDDTRLNLIKVIEDWQDLQERAQIRGERETQGESGTVSENTSEEWRKDLETLHSLNQLIRCQSFCV